MKRVVSVILAVTMLVGMLPTTTWAAGDTLSIGCCEHHQTHDDSCGYKATVEGSDCTHQHTADCYEKKACIHAHGEECSVICSHVCSTDNGCITMQQECVHSAHDAVCGGLDEENQGCNHTCEVVVDGEDSCYALLCSHAEPDVHDEACGYVETVAEKACEYICEECAMEEADAAVVAEVKALIDAIPALDVVQEMSQDEQKAVYEQTQAAYDAYEKLMDEQKAELPDAEAIFDRLFVYFNSLSTEIDIVESGSCGENLAWTLDSDGILTISGNGEMYDFDYNESPWYSDTRIKQVILKNGVTSIGATAFWNCENIVEVIISDSVSTIKEDAFLNCVNLKKIEIPKSVIQIDFGAFSGCLELASITIHDDNPQYCDIDDIVYNKELTELVLCPDAKTGTVVIPDGITTIADSAFDTCTALSNIVIPKSVTIIEDHAFHGCSNLTELIIPDSVKQIGGWAFLGCSGLVNLAIPNSVTEIGNSAFSDCSSLVSITLPENFYGITSNMFRDCSKLSTIKIPDSAQYIDDRAFQGCASLTSITIPDSINRLCGVIFAECNNLKSVFFEGDAPEFTENTFEDFSATIYYPNGNVTWTEDVLQNYGGTINWTAVGEMSIKEQLRQLVEAKDEMTLDEIRAAVQVLDFNELLTAMREDEEVVNYLALLGSSSGVTITNEVPIWNKTFHSAVGLSLNNIQSDDPVRLDKPAAAVDIPDGYDKDTAIHFSVHLDSLGDNRTLTVPVCIDLIVPDDIHPNFQHVFWRNPKTNAVEEIPVVASWTKVGWSIQFVISSEGDFVMTAPENAVRSGKCGDNLTWQYDDTYTLTISGSGEMYDYDVDSNRAPWYSVRENVKHIEIGENVTGIGAYAFYDCRFTDKTVIPTSVEYVGEYAFYGMDEQVFYFEGDAPEIADTAFYYAEYSTIYYHADKQGWPKIISKTFVEAEGLEWVPMKENSDSCGENLTWEFDAATGTLTISGTGEMINTWWPYEMNNDLPEFSPWHNHAEEIKSVVINSGVTSIGHFAFFDCVNLTSVSIPEGVTFVGCAFVGCDSLKELYIPASVTDFRYPSNEGICNGLEKIVVSEENTVYSSDEVGMLYNKEQTKLLGCPTGFRGSCTIPNGVTTIGDWAFYACDGLTSVGIPASVKTIGTAAFSGCEKLDGVVIPEGVTTIPMWAFYGCTDLSEITIPTSVTKLGSGALAECEFLEAVYFEGDAPEIEYDCFNLTATTAYYPADNDTWTEDVRENYCGKLEWVEYAPNNNRCGDELFWEFDADTKTLTISGKGNMYDYLDAGSPWYSLNAEIDHVVISEGATSIGNYAFVSCGMDDIEIPDSVTRIGQGAFALSRIESIKIPKGVAKIEDYTFTRSALNSVVLPEQLKVIGENAFAETALTAITLPESLIEIGAEAFWSTMLTSVTIPENVSVIGAGAFAWCKELASISVAENNASFVAKKDILFDKNGITLIQYPVKKTLETYTVPEGTTAIGAFAFSGVNGLKGISLPNSVISFGECAFIGCSGLTEIKIPKKVTSFALGVFHTCHSLKSITFTGNIPNFAGDWIDEDMVLTAYYPKGDNTWTADKRQDYGGKITWVLVCEHSFGDWHQTKAPTEEAEGEERRDCENCDHYETRSVEKLPHEHGYTSKVTAPTCTEQGYTTYTCRCSDSYVDNYVSALEHSWGSWWEKTAPTCTEEGIKQRDCLRVGCTGAETENVDSLGHSYGEWYESKAPTAETEGEKRRDCIRGDHYETRIIDKLPGSNDGVINGNLGNNLTWALVNGVLTISGVGTMDISEYDYVSSAPWYDNRGTIFSIVISNGISNIDNYAFYDCYNLMSVTVPDSVTSIGKHAFSGCCNLSNIEIPKDVSYIGYNAFYDCSSLTHITIPDGISVLEPSIFEGCSKLTNITIPTTVTQIYGNAFYGCSSLTQVVIPDNITNIDSYTFCCCYSLTNVVIPNSVTSISFRAFAECDSLTDVYYAGSQEEWAAIMISSGNEDLINANVHYFDPSLTADDAYLFVLNEYREVCAMTNDEFNSQYKETDYPYVNQLMMRYYHIYGDMQIVYAFYDIDNNGVAELLVGRGNEQSATIIGLYAFDGNEAVTLNNTAGERSSVKIYTNGTVFMGGALSASEYISKYYRFDASGYKLTVVSAASDLVEIADFDWKPLGELENSKYRFVLSPDVDNLTVATGKSLEIECYLYYGDELVSVWDAPQLSFGYTVGDEPISDVIQYEGWKTCENGYVFTFQGIAIGTAGITLYDEDTETKLQTIITVTSDIEEGDTVRSEWIKQHMEYAESSTYQSDIIPGYQGLMYDEFKKIMDDSGIKFYDITNAVVNFLNANKEDFDQADMYEMLLAELMYSSNSKNAAQELYINNYRESTLKYFQYLCDCFPAGNNALKDLVKYIEAMNKIDDAMSEDFFEAVELFKKTYIENAGPDVKQLLKEGALGLGVDLIFDAVTNYFETDKEIFDYMCYAMAYSATSNDFKNVMAALSDKVRYEMGPEDFPELGDKAQQINWSEFARACDSFVESLERSAEDGMDAEIKEIKKHGKEQFGLNAVKSVAMASFDFLCGLIPVVNVYPNLRAALTAGKAIVEMCTDIDEQSERLALATKLYCMSVALDSVADDFANMLDEDYFWISTTFDESVSLYKTTIFKAIEYMDAYEYSLFQYEWCNAILMETKNEILAHYHTMIRALGAEKDRIEAIECHDSNMNYDSTTDTIVTQYQDAPLYVVACPVDVIITAADGKQIAYLSDDLCNVAAGHEWYYRTITTETGEVLKVAVVPEGYNLSLKGTDTGTMNVSVSRVIGNQEYDVQHFHSVPVSEGSVGYFVDNGSEGKKLIVDDNQQEEATGEYFHTYELSGFNWAEDLTCVATFGCISGDDIQTANCTVTSSTTPATETEAGKIVYTATVDFAGQTYTDTKTETIPATGHSTHQAGTKWISDGMQHWHKCTGCDAKLNLTAHSGETATCTKKAVCAVCGTSYGKLASHDYEKNWSQGDANGHWHECKNCSAHDTQVKHTPGAAATETTAQFCTVCDYVITPALGHTCTAGSKWYSNGTYHWHVCTSCSAWVKTSYHSYSSDTDETCNVCGYIRTVTATEPTEEKEAAMSETTEATDSNEEVIATETAPTMVSTEANEKLSDNTVSQDTDSPGVSGVLITVFAIVALGSLAALVILLVCKKRRKSE